MIKVISLIIIALSIVFIFLSQDKAKKVKAPHEKVSTEQKPVNESEKINKYLQEIEFNKKAQAIKSGKDVHHQDINIGDEVDPLKQDLDAGSGIKKEDTSSSFQQEIEAEKIRLQSQIESTEDPDDAYVQQFIENARKDGLIIKLDKNNQIIDIQKIAE